jgi:ferredoxin
VRIVADREICVGAGLCALTAPEVFDQADSDGLVVVTSSRPHPGILDAVREAVSLCPSGALSLDEDSDAHTP